MFMKGCIQMINIKVRLFAALRKNRNKESVINLPQGSTIKDIIINLNIPESEAAILLVNGKRANLEDCLKDNDVVAIFPAVGGG